VPLNSLQISYEVVWASTRGSMVRGQCLSDWVMAWHIKWNNISFICHCNYEADIVFLDQIKTS
jgi:hypothetical protein